MSLAVTEGDKVLSRRRATSIAVLAVGLAVATLPAAAATPRAAAHTRSVSAVVVVRPGVHLPLAIPGGHVVDVFSHVGSELVRAPLSSLAALARDSRVAGVTPDRSGRVAGLGGKQDNGSGNHGV